MYSASDHHFCHVFQTFSYHSRIAGLGLIPTPDLQISLYLKHVVPGYSELNVRSNRLSDLPEELSLMTSLVTLNMAANMFKRIPEVLRSISSLTHLSAENNCISGTYRV